MNRFENFSEQEKEILSILINEIGVPLDEVWTDGLAIKKRLVEEFNASYSQTK